MTSEIRVASTLYRWLWLSPLLTIPSLVVILLIDPGQELVCGGTWVGCDHNLSGLVTNLVAVLCSSLWYSVLLVPMLNKKSEFVRWHGGQAVLVAGIRTAVPVCFLPIELVVGGGGLVALCSSFPVLVPVWLCGTLWGQEQAKRGDCPLMRWTGQSAGLPLPTDVAIRPKRSILGIASIVTGIIGWLSVLLMVPITGLLHTELATDRTPESVMILEYSFYAATVLIPLSFFAGIALGVFGWLREQGTKKALSLIGIILNGPLVIPLACILALALMSMAP